MSASCVQVGHIRAPGRDGCWRANLSEGIALGASFREATTNMAATDTTL